MLGMDYLSFLVLLIISIVVCAILHYGCKYYVTPGLWSFCSKVVVGYYRRLAGHPGVWQLVFGPQHRSGVLHSGHPRLRRNGDCGRRRGQDL